MANALLLGKATFDKLEAATGFDAELSASLVHTEVYRGRTLHVSTDKSCIAMALNISNDGVHLELGKETKDTKFYAMNYKEFVGLLEILAPNVSGDRAGELFNMAIRIEERQRQFM
ncbi:TPA: hypothetical protein ACGXNJ_002949 [Bacillus cereus]